MLDVELPCLGLWEVNAAEPRILMDKQQAGPSSLPFRVEPNESFANFGELRE